MQILIVDDELVNRRLLVRYLKKQGHCDTARDGAAACSLVKDSLEQYGPYDLILLDIKMPVMDGMTALNAIRDLEQQHEAAPAKIVMATVMDDPQSIVEAYAQLCDGYLTKPFDNDKLKSLLVELFPELKDATF